MSILLDALKKSEAQRQLGETPTLQTPVSDEEMDSGNDRQWIPIVMLLLTASVITWIGLVQYSQPEVIETSIDVADTVDQSGANENSDTAAVRDAENSAGTPVMNYSAPAEADEVDQSDPSLAMKEPELESEGVHDEITEGEPEETPIVYRGPLDETKLADEDDSIDQSDVPVADDYKLEPISYWQLPQSLRDELPEIRITVLVYAEKPEDRFLLINGERMRESDELAGGLGLEEIQRDRAIFTFRKYRFHLKS